MELSNEANDISCRSWSRILFDRCRFRYHECRALRPVIDFIENQLQRSVIIDNASIRFNRASFNLPLLVCIAARNLQLESREFAKRVIPGEAFIFRLKRKQRTVSTFVGSRSNSTDGYRRLVDTGNGKTRANFQASISTLHVRFPIIKRSLLFSHYELVECRKLRLAYFEKSGADVPSKSAGLLCRCNNSWPSHRIWTVHVAEPVITTIFKFSFVTPMSRKFSINDT